MFSKFYQNSDKNQTPGVYKISCKNCNQIYVKLTGRALSFIINEHKYCVKTNQSSALTVHSSIGYWVNLSYAYIMYPENNFTIRIIAEVLLIKNLQTFPENKPLFDLNVF